MDVVWRTIHDPVRNIVTLLKPIGITGKEAQLKKGIIVLVCGLHGGRRQQALCLIICMSEWGGRPWLDNVICAWLFCKRLGMSLTVLACSFPGLTALVLCLLVSRILANQRTLISSLPDVDCGLINN